MQALTRSYYYIAALTLIFFLSDNSCFGNDDSLKVRRNIIRLAKKISHSKILIEGPVGFGATITKQFERFMVLEKEATDTELIIFTNHKSAIVRVGAFDILMGRNYKDIKTILENHISDTTYFDYQVGCIRMSNRVNQYFLGRLTRTTNRIRNFTLSDEEIEYYNNKISQSLRKQIE